jgi:PAS domain S-box-containing protein
MFASPSHERLGYKPEDLVGKSGATMIVEEDLGPLRKQLEKFQKRNLSRAFLNYRIKDKKGKIHYYRGSFDAVFKTDGSMERIICVGEDITELRKAQSEKEKAYSLAAESEKFALVGQVAGKMAHDFNNILGVVMGNAELAMIDCQDDGTKKTLELIYNQTIRGKNLTKNLVAFAKDQEPRQEFFKIDEKMDLVITLLKKDIEGIAVTREYGHDVPEILADPGMIEHAIINLVQNSIHATSLVEQPKITMRTFQQDGRICIEIEDNGCGIPQEFLGDIFKPSFTLKGSRDKKGRYKPGIKGTGYGMANVKKYVEQHKGVISIHSEQKKGTKVTISLPIIKKELSVKEIEEIKQEKSCFEKYILLVEDEQAISDVQYRILTHEPCSHRVDIAGNGQVAIDLLGRNEYDLISLDYILPAGFNGMDIYHHVRETDKTIPILFISGNIEFLESIKELKQKDPYIDHLSKPCMNIDYLNSINKLLGKLTP